MEDARGISPLVPCEGVAVNSQEALYQEAYDRAAQRNSLIAESAGDTETVTNINR